MKYYEILLFYAQQNSSGHCLDSTDSCALRNFLETVVIVVYTLNYPTSRKIKQLIFFNHMIFYTAVIQQMVTILEIKTKIAVHVIREITVIVHLFCIGKHKVIAHCCSGYSGYTSVNHRCIFTDHSL